MSLTVYCEHYSFHWNETFVTLFLLKFIHLRVFFQSTISESETDEKEETKKDDDEDDDEVAPGTENLAAPGDEPSQIVLPEVQCCIVTV